MDYYQIKEFSAYAVNARIQEFTFWFYVYTGKFDKNAQRFEPSQRLTWISAIGNFIDWWQHCKKS